MHENHYTRRYWYNKVLENSEKLEERERSLSNGDMN